MTEYQRSLLEQGVKELSDEELLALSAYMTGSQKERQEMPEPFNMPVIDDMLTRIDAERERMEVMLYYVLPFFDRTSADSDILHRIEWNYNKIRVLLETSLDSLNTIEAQYKRWTRITKGLQDLKEKEDAKQKTPGAAHDVVLTWVMPTDGTNIFDGYTRIHSKEKGEHEQSAQKSLEQLAWIIDRLRKDDIFDRGEDGVAEDLERAVMELGIILSCRNRPFLPADEAGGMLREAFNKWKGGREDE